MRSERLGYSADRRGSKIPEQEMDHRREQLRDSEKQEEKLQPLITTTRQLDKSPSVEIKPSKPESQQSATSTSPGGSSIRPPLLPAPPDLDIDPITVALDIDRITVVLDIDPISEHSATPDPRIRIKPKRKPSDVLFITKVKSEPK